jgi:hypothetical protein
VLVCRDPIVSVPANRPQLVTAVFHYRIPYSRPYIIYPPLFVYERDLYSMEDLGKSPLP